MNRRLMVAVALVAALGVLLLAGNCGGAEPGVGSPGVVPNVQPSTANAPPPDAPVLTAPTAPASTVPATPSAEPSHDEDGGAADTPHSPAAITDGERDPREFAIVFMSRYLNTFNKSPEQWRESWGAMTTLGLYTELAEVDPATVPVGDIGSGTTVAPAGDALVKVTVPVVDPQRQPVVTVLVTLTGITGAWRVSELDVVKP